MFIVAPLIGGAIAALAAPFFETAVSKADTDPTGADVPGMTGVVADCRTLGPADCSMMCP